MATFVSLSSSFVLSLLLLTTISTATTSPPTAPAPHPPPPPPPHHHHHHPSPPPSHPPTPPPSHPPVKPPAHPPVKPPTHAPAKPPVKPPTHAPAKPPMKPPTHAPAKPPVKPPTHAPAKPPVKPPMMRKKVAVEGVVFCKSCKYRGVDTLTGAAPLAGAVVKLQCNNSKKALVEQQKTDKNGYFFFKPEHLTTSGSHKCKVFLISSPVAACTVPTNLHGGALGAILTRKPPVDTPPKAKVLPFELFTVGPFAFEASKKLPCHY